MKTTIRKNTQGESRAGRPVLFVALLTMAVCLAGGSARAQITIPATYVLPSSAADTSQPGFIWRVHQVAVGQENSSIRTERQLTGLLGENIADPFAPNAALASANPPSPATAPITFDIGTVINMNAVGYDGTHYFMPDDAFPGLPGLTFNCYNVAAEILTWLDLPAGITTLGVNSDDGFKMTIGGANPSDPLALKVGEYDGGRASTETLISLEVPQAGLYPMRCTWNQGTGNANLEIYSVAPGGFRILVNDSIYGGIPAYRAVVGAPARACARAVSPLPGATDAGLNAPIVVELVDGDVPVEPSTITLSLNGDDVPVTTAKAEDVCTITYTPAASYAESSQQSVVLAYMEGDLTISRSWSFRTVFSIPATFVLPSSAADATQPGFIWRIHQVASSQDNNNTRTENQLAGALGENMADPYAQSIALAPALPPDPSTAPITFEIETAINLSIWGAENAGNFAPDDAFPGLPGWTANHDNVAAEILTWLDLPAGTITMGVNSDDGFRMTIGGANPSDRVFSKKVGEFEGGRGSTDTIFSFEVLQAGLYATRCTWEQGSGGANIELFTLRSDGTKVLLNDSANGGIPAYRAVTAPARAHAQSVSPAPGATGVPLDAPIVVELVDGAVPIDPATMTLSVNGLVVVPTASKTGAVSTITYTPSTPYSEFSRQTAALGYNEAGSPMTVSWSFETRWVNWHGNFETDFNQGQPQGTRLLGAALIDSGGVLKLTTADNYWVSGWFVIEDMNDLEQVYGFDARFKLLIGGGQGGAGFSFSFGNDIPENPVQFGMGLGVVFDTYDNPGIYVRYGGAIVGSVPGNGDLFRTGDFVEVAIKVTDQGNLDLAINGTQVFAGLPVGLVPATGRFVFEARTSDATDNHWIDDLAIKIVPPSFPYVVSFAPAGPNVRWDALIKAVIKDMAAAQLNPASLQMSLNGIIVNPDISRTGDETTVSYRPGLMPPGGNAVTIVYADTAGQSHTYTRGFDVMQYIGPNGNLYEPVRIPNSITWPDAKIAAEQRTFLGRPGHLATIAGYEEDLYLEFLRQASGVGAGELWVGGFQVPGSEEPGGGWMWVNNEGPIPGSNYEGRYANWQAYQPDNWHPELGGENYLAIGLNGNFGWNDTGLQGGGYNGTLSGFIVEYEGVEVVGIDIKPGDNKNPIQLASNGKLPVAVLSSRTFDAATVDPATVRFGRTGTEAAPISFRLIDVNGDKRKDLLCHFNTQETGLTCDDKAGLLTAKLRNGIFGIKGSDSIHPLNCPQYALSVLGMQDVNKLTDVLLTLNVVAQNVAPPVLAQHVQFKSVDLVGRLRWTANVQNVALTPTSATASEAALPFMDLKRGEPLKVQMQVPSGQADNTLLLLGQGVVLFRPDFAVSSVDCPSSVGVGMVASIPVVIEERNGDLGATATVYLMEGETVLDSRSGVYLGPQQTATVVFSAVFAELGTHNLKIVVGELTPRDYDLSNNKKAFTVEVAQQPAYYNAGYSWAQQELAYAYGVDFYWYYTNFHKGKEESLYEDLYLPVALTFPLDNVRVELWADGTQSYGGDLPGLVSDYTYDDGYGYSYSQLWRELGPGFSLYIESVKDSYGYQNSRASLQKYAGDYVYYSAEHDWYWGEGGEGSWQPYLENYGVVQTGEFLDAKTAVDIRLVVRTSGSEYGGTANLSLYNASWDTVPYENRYSDGYFYILTSDKGEQYSGYNSGYITP
ncbi:MAG TPA: hypothetical protein VJA21_33200 [Verrucomicrobiae bacterium]